MESKVYVIYVSYESSIPFDDVTCSDDPVIEHVCSTKEKAVEYLENMGYTVNEFNRTEDIYDEYGDKKYLSIMECNFD